MNTKPKYFQVERDGPVIVWKYSNPPRNLLIPGAWDELVALVKEFDADPDLRVGIVTSAVPGMFIQHFDASVLMAWADAMNKMSDEEVSQMLDSLPRPCGIAAHTAKPIICSINGPVEGGGSELALGCDLRFIARDAYMGQPEVIGGLIPGGGGTQRLARLVGVSRALEFCLTARRIYPDEAERLGLVVKACDPKDLQATVMAFAQELATRPPLGVQAIKKAIYEGSDMQLQDGLVMENRLLYDLIRTDDALRILGLYVASGQDRDRFEQAMQEEQKKARGGRP
jgi:enoyl-CoA hydratase